LLNRRRPDRYAVDTLAGEVTPDEVERLVEDLSSGAPVRDGAGGALGRFAPKART
jgi:hypothetical protein